MNIYVGNLAYSVSAQDLVNVFSEFGHVNSARLVKDPESHLAMGFGFVEMASHAEAIKAIAQLNGIEMRDRTLVVNAARHRQDGHDLGEVLL